jgi:hypothetical protein
MFHNPFNSKVVADITKFLNEHRNDVRINPCLDEAAKEAAGGIDLDGMLIEEKRAVLRLAFNEAVGKCGCKGTNQEANEFTAAFERHVEEGKKLPPEFLKNIEKKKKEAKAKKESVEEGEDRRPFDHLGEAKASSTIEFSLMSKDFDGMESAYDSLPRRLKSMQTGSGMALGSGMRDHGYECKSKSDMDAIVAHYKKKVKSLTVKKHSAESVEEGEHRRPFDRLDEAYALEGFAQPTEKELRKLVKYFQTILKDPKKLKASGFDKKEAEENLEDALHMIKTMEEFAKDFAATKAKVKESFDVTEAAKKQSFSDLLMKKATRKKEPWEEAYYKWFDGVSIGIFDMGKVAKEIQALIAAKANLDVEMPKLVKKYGKNN